MAIYQWKGLDGNQTNSGEIEAANQQEATDKLQLKGIIITQIVLISGKEEGISGTLKKKQRDKKVKTKELMIFTKKFATMVEAGLPIMKAITMLREQTENPNFKNVVSDIHDTVEGGTTLSAAFEKHPVVFDSIYINILRAGETSGKLTTFMYKLVEQLEKSEKIRSKVKGALTYPVIVMCVAFSVILIMLIKVVPVFQQMFKSMGNNLPGPTQLIVDISDFLRNPAQGGLLFATIIGTFILIRLIIKKNTEVRYRFHKLLLKIPLVGDVIQKSTLAKIAMIEGNLSAAGVPVLEALSIVMKTVNNLIYRDAIKYVQNGISAGRPLSALYGECAVIPPTFAQMLEVGEETGNMDEMLAATARYYEEEFDMVVDRMTEMLEPIMIVFMGLTVGFIIVAMYMPIFQMGDMVGSS